MNIIRIVPVVLAVALAACGTDKSNQAATGGAASQADTSMDGMQGMGSMGGMMGNDMKNMESHMQQMMGAGADSMQAMLPMHRQMTANMLAEMNKQMRDMKMPPERDTAWSAAVDSIRQDLVRMPEMDGKELRSFMPAHRERMMRLMEMHQGMMKNMKM